MTTTESLFSIDTSKFQEINRRYHFWYLLKFSDLRKLYFRGCIKKYVGKPSSIKQYKDKGFTNLVKIIVLFNF